MSSSQLQSPPSQSSRKRPLSPDQVSEVLLDRHVKKTRVSTTPTSLKQDKKRRRKKKRLMSVVENKSNVRTAGLERKSSDAHTEADLKATPVTVKGQLDGLVIEPENAIVSSSHPSPESSPPFLRRKSSSPAKVDGLFSPVRVFTIFSILKLTSSRLRISLHQRKQRTQAPRRHPGLQIKCLFWSLKSLNSRIR
jgi:hypothetical protein